MRGLRAILAILFAAACLAAFSSRTAIAQAKGEGAPAGFKASKAWNKLDAGLQQAWQDAKKAGDMSRRLDCFVRVRAPADEGDQSFLISHGFIVRQFAGTIATGHMKAADLPSVAELPFVDSIKLAKPPANP